MTDVCVENENNTSIFKNTRSGWTGGFGGPLT